jgi:hypothetical protein
MLGPAQEERPPGMTRGALTLLLRGLRTNAYRYVFPSAVLTAKSDVADEVVASNSPPLKQQREGIIRNSTAAAGQPEAGISL